LNFLFQLRENLRMGNYSLILAVKSGVLEWVIEEIQNGANNYWIGMIAAIEKGHLHIVKYFVENGIEINDQSNELFEIVAKYGQFDILKYLLNHHKNIDSLSSWKFISAISNGHLNIIEYITEKGLDVYENRELLSCYSVRSGNLHITRYLVELGSSLSYPGEWDLKDCITNEYLSTYIYTLEVKNKKIETNELPIITLLVGFFFQKNDYSLYELYDPNVSMIIASYTWA
jgi:hypothetical protein